MNSTSLLLILVAFGFFSCTSNNAPLTQQEKEKLTTEINTVMNSMMEGMKILDVSQTFKNFLFNDDFKYIYYINGKIRNSNAFLELVQSNFDVVKKVEWGVSVPDIRIVTPDVAIVTLIYHGTYYFPESTLTSPDVVAHWFWENRQMAGKSSIFRNRYRNLIL